MDGRRGEAMLHSLPMLQLALSFAAGSLSTLSPCVFPLLPVVASSAADPHRRAGPLVMGAGMVASFVVVGIALAMVGPALDVDAAQVRTLAAVALLVVGVAMLAPPSDGLVGGALGTVVGFVQRVASRIRPETLVGAFALGALLGVLWSPCSGPLLGSGLALVATGEGLRLGGVILGAFGLGAALPLVCAAYLSRTLFARARRWLAGHGAVMRRIFAIAIVSMAVAVLTGLDHRIEAALVDSLPQWWLAMTTRF